MAQGAVKLLVTGEATLSNDDLPLLFILILLSSPLVFLCFSFLVGVGLIILSSPCFMTYLTFHV